MVWQGNYRPFGEVDVIVNNVANYFRFPGQIFDPESGLHYNWNRYYNPETGRYISADPIGIDGGVNLFAYVDGDPVNDFDQNGLYAGSVVKVVEKLIFWTIAALAAKEGVEGTIDASKSRTSDQCKEDLCIPYEKNCIGTAKTVEKHNYGSNSHTPHMHPGVCDNLADKINKAIKAGCGNRPGVIYAKGVFNSICDRDWSKLYPNNTPKFNSYYD